MWKFLVKNQSIEILEREVLADHQIQYVQFKFTFDGDWKRYHKTVQFSQCDEVYSIVLGVDGTSCYLPAELHVGACKMSVFGYDTESDTTVRATTVPVTLNIRHSGFIGDDEPPIPPTPDLYTQLLKRIEDAEKGLDGKSAYQIACEHGYVGTEEEWLASLKGKDGVSPDMSEYPKTTEVQTIVETVIQPVAEEAHSHDNKAVLDSLTPELFTELYELQQFEDKTVYDIQTVNEEILNLQQYKHNHNNQAVLDRITKAMISAMEEYGPFEDWTREQIHTLFESVNNFSNTAHTHENKAVLDTITEQFMRDLTAFQASTANALHGLSTGLSEVSAQAHSHANKAVLDSITQEMLDDIASISTMVGQAHWHHNLEALNGITGSHISRWNEAYTAAMNLNERVGVNEGVFERFKTEILYDMQGAKTSITDINTRLAAVEEALAGVETALAAIVEVTV